MGTGNAHLEPTKDETRNARQKAAAYVRIARPDHWIKNIFVLPGVALGMLLVPIPAIELVAPLVIALVATNAITSANYVINELLDADSDRYHPSKRFRPAAAGLVTTRLGAIEYAALGTVGLALAYLVGVLFFSTGIVLLGMGVLYNAKPFRLKDRPHLDILSESVNNPLRLLLGWAVVVPNGFPPSSIVLAYWFGGAFLMSVKRFAELRSIGDLEVAKRYRASFAHYNEERLLLSSLFYSLSFAFFMGIFLIKYRVEFLLTFPLFALLFTWYFAIGLRSNSVAQTPEHLYREWRLFLLIAFIALVVVALLVIDLPLLAELLNPIEY